MALASLDLRAIKWAVEALGHPQRVAFAAFWAQRLRPMYTRFSEMTGQGDPQFVQNCLDTTWSAAAGESVSRTVISPLQERLVELSPEIDTPPILAYAAMESTAAAWDALNVIDTGSVDSAAAACTGFSQVVYHFLMNRDHRGVRVASKDSDPLGLANDPIWEREVTVLNQILDTLAVPSMTSDVLKVVRTTAEHADGMKLVEDVASLSSLLSRTG